MRKMVLLRYPISLWMMFTTTIGVSTISHIFSFYKLHHQDEPIFASDNNDKKPFLPPTPTFSNADVITTVTSTKTRVGETAAELPTHALASNVFDYRVCTSPEDHVEWPLAGPIQSRTSSLTCGLESESPFSLYLRHHLNTSLSSIISAQNCDRLVIYGVAFGAAHVKSLSTTHTRMLNSKRLLDTHGKCFFMFVLEEDMPSKFREGKSSKASDAKIDPVMAEHTWLIPIPRHVLPYDNLRRNVKLLKYNGHFLFQQAKAVIWQDAKFFQRVNVRKQPSNYFDLIPQDACTQVMGLPVHPNVFGPHIQGAIDADVPYETQYIHHCETIIESLVKRPDVTDSATNLMRQCHAYLQHVVEEKHNPSILNHGLLDSAFIVWNQTTPLCRAFNAALQCTLSDQVQCHSDRDQVSIPFVFYKMGLRVRGGVEGPQAVDGRRTDFEFVVQHDDVEASVSSQPQAMVRMTRSACHWYFSRLGACSPRDQPSVAILVSGGATRFLFSSTVEHLLKPIVRKQGYRADYYAMLTLEKSLAYREGSSYMDHITHDPIFNKAFKRGRKDETEIMKGIRDTMRDAVEDAGAYMADSKFLVKSPQLDSPDLRRKHAVARRQHREEDVDLRFPTLDLRTKAASRTPIGNRNMLRLFYNLENQWDKLVLFETVVGTPYDYVMILRDDTFWLDDFDMGALLATNPDADAYILSCDDRKPPMLEYEVNDHGIVLKREKAQIFGKYFSTLLSTDLEECHRWVSDTVGPERGCNSEMILNWIIRQNHIVVQKVPQSLFPFERSMTVQEGNGKTKTCFHKFCQSRDEPLWIDPDIKRCADLSFD